MGVRVANLETVALQPSDHSFCHLREKKESNVLRDSWVLISPENSPTRTLTAGYTTVYPGCRTGGHSHEDYEEVYHITKGKGIMTVGEEEFEVSAGDTFLVPFGLYHTVRNPYQGVLEYFWVISLNHEKAQK
ncbi:MAG: cupin domain-containing protein [Firmicutes bacterium]|nr:cupin domain-containing protein [Bacillota bacterium]